MSVGVVVGIVVLHSPWYDNDEVVSEAAPLDVPAKSVIVRIDAPIGGCWRATISEESPRQGCGSVEFPFEVEDSLSMFVERLGPPQPVSAAIEVDGEVVQTVGPTTVEYSTFTIFYGVPVDG